MIFICIHYMYKLCLYSCVFVQYICIPAWLRLVSQRAYAYVTVYVYIHGTDAQIHIDIHMYILYICSHAGPCIMTYTYVLIDMWCIMCDIKFSKAGLLSNELWKFTIELTFENYYKEEMTKNISQVEMTCVYIYKQYYRKYLDIYIYI